MKNVMDFVSELLVDVNGMGCYGECNEQSIKV